MLGGVGVGSGKKSASVATNGCKRMRKSKN